MSSPPAGEWELTKHYWTASLLRCPTSHLLQWVRDKAALFGGLSGSVAIIDDLLIVELSRDTVVSVMRIV